MGDVDVVIVGAGAAGLAAAKAVRAAGLSFALVEAADRIGGRAWTRDAGLGAPFDWGCAWLHAADRNPFHADARALGWTLHEHDMSLDHLWFGRTRAGAADLARVENAAAALEACILREGRADDRLSSALGVGRCARVNATMLGPMDYGMDPDEISTDDYMNAEDLDPNLLTREGFGALVAAWGADVPVTTACPVRRITWSGPGVDVETSKGTLRGRAAIVTVSTGVLQFEEIGFAPDLPLDHWEAIFDLPMGLLTKIPLRVSGDRMGLAPFDDLLIERPALHDLFFLCFPFDTDQMVGFVGGDFAWEIEAAGAAAAVDFATDRLVDLFGSDLRGRVSQGTMTDWAGNRWTRGAYAAARPGRAGSRGVLRRPVGERIWFAGEALAGGLTQTCGGARLSGAAVGAEVAAHLAR